MYLKLIDKEPIHKSKVFYLNHKQTLMANKKLIAISIVSSLP